MQDAHRKITKTLHGHIPTQPIIELGQDLDAQVIHSSYESHVFYYFARGGNRHEDIVNKMCAGDSSEILDLSQDAHVAVVILVEETLDQVSQLFVALQVLCESLAHLSG